MPYALALAALAALALAYLCVSPAGLVGPAMGLVLRASAYLDRGGERPLGGQAIVGGDDEGAR